MLSKLIKFIILSRIPKTTLILYILLSLFLVFTSLESYGYEKPSVVQQFALFSILYSTFLVVLPLFSSRFGMFSKSDSDFLAMLPIDDKTLVTSIIVGSILVNLTLSLVFVSWYILAIGIYGILVPPLLSLLSSSLSAISYSFNTKRRAFIAIAISAWFLSALAGFPLSPMSLFIGYQIEGFILLATFSIASFIIAIRNFSFTSYSNVSVLSEKGEVKEQISFSKATSPLVAMLMKNLNVVEIGGRANFMGSVTYFVRRVKFWQILLVSSIVGVSIYIAYALKVANVFALNMYVIIVVWFLSSFLSNSALLSEPIWLDLSIMNPLEFFRNYLTSKTISLILIFLPIGIFEILTGQSILGLAIIFDIPLTSIFLISINARYYRVNLQTLQTVTLGRMLVSFLLLIPFAILEVIAFLPIPIVFLIGTILLLAIDLPFLFSSSYWESTVEKILTSVT